MLPPKNERPACGQRAAASGRQAGVQWTAGSGQQLAKGDQRRPAGDWRRGGWAARRPTVGAGAEKYFIVGNPPGK